LNSASGSLAGYGWSFCALQVVGEAPNLAARLQTLAAPNEVVIGPGTHRLVSGLFNLVDLGSNDLKGFGDQIQAWRVLGESRVESRFAARTATGLTPFIGRQPELSMLLDRFEQARDAEGQVVLLSGEPGIGKSRLAHALLERLADESHTQLRYYCSPYHVNSALHPIIEQLERAASFEPEDDPDPKLEKLEMLLSRTTKDTSSVAPLFASLLSLPAGSRYPPLDMPAQRQRELTIAALLDHLGGLAAHRPLLIVLEDGQWLDPTSTELFERLIERVQTLPVLLLITFRPEFAPRWISYPHMTALTLNRLGRRHGTQMIAVVAGGKPLPETIVAQIWAKTEGVPLFVEELTKAVLESGLLEDKGDRYELTGRAAPLVIPSTLQDSLMARLDRLAPVKEVAQIGAVIGREFSYRLLVALSSLDERALQEALSHLINSELIFRRGTIPDATYSFKHAFVQEAAYRSLLKGNRQQLHARVAGALSERFPELTASQPEILAHHLTEAGLTIDAVVGWKRAGDLAAERSANVEAAAHLRRALDLLRTLPASSERNEQELDLLTALGSLLQVTQGYGHVEAGTVYRRARDLCQSVNDAFRLAPVLQGLRMYHMYAGDRAPAYEAAQELLALGDRTGEPDYLVEGHRSIGMVQLFAGEFHASRDHLERGIALYDFEARGKAALRYGYDSGVVCLSYVARALWILGYPDQALQRSEYALAVAQVTRHAANIVEAMVMRADIAMLRREVQDARDLAAAALALASEHGLPLPEQGHGADGVVHIRKCLAVLVATNVGLYRPYYLARLADALGKAGRVAEGLSTLDEAIDSSRRSGMRYWDAELQRCKGELLLTASNADRDVAEACFRQAIDIARVQSAKSLELRAAPSSPGY
jgi:predicted ATPase